MSSNADIDQVIQRLHLCRTEEEPEKEKAIRECCVRLMAIIACQYGPPSANIPAKGKSLLILAKETK